MLVACSQQDAPAAEIARTAEEVIGETSPAPALAQGKYAPRDACGKIAGASLFRLRLALAVEARDAEGVAALAADDIKLDFGEGAGRAELDHGRGARVASCGTNFGALLDLGRAENDQGGITLPWYFDQEIPIDPYDGMIVTGENVPLLLGPDPQSQPASPRSTGMRSSLTAGLVTENPFLKVKFDGKEGYVATDKLRSLIDYLVERNQPQRPLADHQLHRRGLETLPGGISGLRLTDCGFRLRCVPRTVSYSARYCSNSLSQFARTASVPNAEVMSARCRPRPQTWAEQSPGFLGLEVYRRQAASSRVRRTSKLPPSAGWQTPRRTLAKGIHHGWSFQFEAGAGHLWRHICRADHERHPVCWALCGTDRSDQQCRYRAISWSPDRHARTYLLEIPTRDDSGAQWPFGDT